MTLFWECVCIIMASVLWVMSSLWEERQRTRTLCSQILHQQDHLGREILAGQSQAKEHFKTYLVFGPKLLHGNLALVFGLGIPQEPLLPWAPKLKGEDALILMVGTNTRARKYGWVGVMTELMPEWILNNLLCSLFEEFCSQTCSWFVLWCNSPPSLLQVNIIEHFTCPLYSCFFPYSFCGLPVLLLYSFLTGPDWGSSCSASLSMWYKFLFPASL